MLSYFRFFFVLFVIVGTGACHPTTNNGHIVIPDFVNDPSAGGTTGGVGIAKPHLKGVHFQRSLAISRAINEIAMQMGTQVEHISEITTAGSRDENHTNINTYSIQTVDGNTVSAQLKSVWIHPKTNEIYVWMVTK